MLTLFFLFFFTSQQLFATSCQKSEDWIEHFVLAQKYVGEKNGDLALAEFTKAIELNPDQLFLYLQRGLIYIKKHQYDNALPDLTYVIDYPNAHISLLLPALRGRALCYLKIDGGDACFPRDMSRTNRFQMDFCRAKALDANSLENFSNENYDIDVNISRGDLHNPLYREMYVEMQLALGTCTSPDAIKFYDNGVVITKRSYHDCQCCRSDLKKKPCLLCGMWGKLKKYLFTKRKYDRQSNCKTTFALKRYQGQMTLFV